MQKNQAKRYHQIAIALALIVVGLGAYTRLKHAGLGCPDWPKCFANWIVHANITTPALSSVASEKAWIEMIHRYAAGILCIIVFSLRLTAPKTRNTTWLNTTCILLVIQALFGMWTVTWRLHPLAVMPHLIGGMSITTLLCIDYHKEYVIRPSTHIPHRIHRYLQLLLVAMIIQIIIGGWTSANYAALVCPDFPRCQGQWLVSFDYLMQGFSSPLGFSNYEGGVISGEGRIAIHITHRWGALICSILMTRTAWLVARVQHQLPLGFMRWFYVLSVCFVLQIAFGIINVLWQLPISIAVGHNIMALALLISVNMLLRYSMHHKTAYSTSNHYYQHAIV